MKKSIIGITKNPNEPHFACNLCWPAIMELGSIPDVGYLCYLKNIVSEGRNEKFGEDGTYVLILTSGQGHWDDELVIPEKPRKDIDPTSGWSSYKPET